MIYIIKSTTDSYLRRRPDSNHILDSVNDLNLNENFVKCLNIFDKIPETFKSVENEFFLNFFKQSFFDFASNELKTNRKWIESKENILKSQKESINLKDIEIQLNEQKSFQTEIENKWQEMIKFEEKVYQIIDNSSEIRKESEKLKEMLKQLEENSNQRENGLKRSIEFNEHIIEKYKIQFKEEYKIGSGAFGDVYKVKDISNGSEYAIKLISGKVFQIII